MARGLCPQEHLLYADAMKGCCLPSEHRREPSWNMRTGDSVADGQSPGSGAGYRKCYSFN